MDDKKTKNNNYYNDSIDKIENLIKEEKYEKALDILVEEMSMPYIPLKYEETFSKLFRKITIDIEELESKTKFRTILKEEEIIDALNNSDVEPLHLELAISSLKNINIRIILKEIKIYLQNKDKDDFIKTLILLELVNQNIDEEIKIIKDNNTTLLKPSDLTLFDETKSLAYISRAIEEQMFQDQTQQLIAFGIMQTILIFKYPQELELENFDLLAASCHYMSSIYLRKDEQIEAIMKMYKIINKDKLLNMITEIQKILDKRQISFQ